MLRIEIELKQGEETEILPLLFPEKASEITLRQMQDIELHLEQYPKELERPVTEWSSDDMITHYAFMLNTLKIVALTEVKSASGKIESIPANIEELMELPAEYRQDVCDSVSALYVMLRKAIRDYEPKKITSFEYKGYKFYVPESFKNRFNIEKIGAKMKTVEVVEALQLEHVLGAKNEDGTYALKDRKYHSNIGVMACVCRMQKPDGSKETLPLDTIERRKFIDDRCVFFEDITMDVALDVAFFLLGSKKKYNQIQQLATYMNRLLKIQSKLHKK